MTSRNLEDAAMGKRALPWTIAASFLLHGVAYASLGAAPVQPPHAPRRTQVRFEVTAPPKTEAPPPALPRSAPPPAKPRAKKAEVASAAPPAPPPVTPEPPPADGTTLAGAGDGSGNTFSMPLGHGGALDPTRVPTLPLPTRPVSSPAAMTRPAPEPALVAVGDLSARPSPPALGAALERNYPADARQRGLSGSAKVRARIDPDGVVRRVVLVDESAAGFGAACHRALSGSRWAAPKDKAGRPVATEIRYTCRFVVAP